MNMASKILWSEGLSVGPQQFQQQDLYHETRLQRMASALNQNFWGVRSIRWNVRDLESSTLCAQSMSVIFQDGDMIDAPMTDQLPANVDLGKLPLDQQTFTFYAALPGFKPHGGNLSADARYQPQENETLDLFSEAVPIEVVYLKSAPVLLSQLDSRENHVSFPIVRVRRVPTGGFEIDPRFIPPCIAIVATDELPRMLNSLLGKMNAKIEALYARHRMTSKHTFEVRSGDISSFWMLNTISTASASLLHCARSGSPHPEFLFEKLMMLAGGLMTFSNKYAIDDLPDYKHEDAGPAFQKLDEIIRDLIDIVLASNYVSLPLTQDSKRTSHHRGSLEAAKIGPQTELIVAVNADMPALELVATVPRLFKIGSQEGIDAMIVSALPGIPLLHLAQIPSAIPVRPNTYYFSIQAKGTLYETMVKSQTIAIYVPASLPGLKLELLAIEN